MILLEFQHTGPSTSTIRRPEPEATDRLMWLQLLRDVVVIDEASQAGLEGAHRSQVSLSHSLDP